MDFKRLRRPSIIARPTDPEEIFTKLPKLRETPNDLWRGQADALRLWHANRDKTDILISLNTGGGKTIVGLLIAQSIVNEAAANVLYACSTIDLVKQTSREADKLGLKHTVRVRGQFNNDLFETGKAFCITTYAALFNPYSRFRSSLFPSGIVFDDAHVAEKMMRDAFTLSIPKKDLPDLFQEMAGLFAPEYEELGRAETFQDVVNEVDPLILMAPPGSVLRLENQIAALLRKYQLAQNDALKYAYRHIKDNLANCAILFSSYSIEFTPAFLPVFSLPYFDTHKTRRIYLSATLNYKSDIARAFGSVPKIVIEPKNDAGNGERLILFSKFFEESQVSIELMEGLKEKHKAVVAVPSYKKAGDWGMFALPPSREDFSDKLDAFREAEKGIFLLVFRIDGIDLPDDTCRVMVIDHLPTGATLIERFQWERLNMNNFHATKLANRLTQLFGRINRGRKDYGAFILNGRDLNSWLQNDRNIALLPELLRKQVILGLSVHDQLDLSKPAAILDAINRVMDRNSDWIEFYSDNIEGMDITESAHERAREVEEQLTYAAITEVAFASAIWERDYSEARRILEGGIEDLRRADSRLAGWHNVWIGMCLEAEGDVESAFKEYDRARARLGSAIILPKASFAPPQGESLELDHPTANKMCNILSAVSEDSFNRELRNAKRGLADLHNVDATSPRHEEAVRCLGEFLGFEATRPDNEFGTGPDVLWLDGEANIAISLELKTDKEDPATYFKKDLSQAHDHIAWVAENRPDAKHLGLIFVGPDGVCDDKANPSDLMFHCTLPKVAQLADSYLAAYKDIRTHPPLWRPKAVHDFCVREAMNMQGCFERLAVKAMKDMKS